MKNMKIEYQKPEMGVVLLDDIADIVTVSGKGDGTPPSEDFGNMGWG